MILYQDLVNRLSWIFGRQVQVRTVQIRTEINLNWKVITLKIKVGQNMQVYSHTDAINQ